MTDIVIMGNSHIRALDVPMTSSDGLDHVAPLEAHGEGVFGFVGGSWPRQFDQYWQASKDAARDRVAAVFWGGNIHLARFLFAPEPLFDFVASDAPELPLDESVELVPESAVQVVLAPPVLQISKTLQELTSVAAKVLYCGSPPPKGDDAFIRQRVKHEPYFVQLAAGLNLDLAQVRLSPALLRLKLWHALQRLMREAAEQAGATFVPAPEDGQIAPGYLHPDCYAADSTHANKVYGARAVENIRRYAR